MVLTPGTTLDNGFSLEAYSPSFLFVNRHFNTMYPYAMRNNPIPVYQRERWETDDGDFFDLDFIKKGAKSIVILLHGLEGSSSSQYILGIANALTTFLLIFVPLTTEAAAVSSTVPLAFTTVAIPKTWLM
ncbi:MAG: hypothetical protein IPP37_07515 [Saprospiraceae bacterium]|nr:hypothetical protein [Saprospiraceae bacterium]